MSVNIQALEALARRNARFGWLKIWYLGVRRDFFRAKKAVGGSGWWSDLQDNWPAEEWKHDRTH